MGIAEKLSKEEEELSARVRILSLEGREKYHRLVRSTVKDPDTYAALNWFCICGLHHFYVGKWFRGFFTLLLMVIGIAYFFNYGWFLIAGLLALELFELFRSQIIIQKLNLARCKEILTDIESSN
jgi:TM2 domain-containing membrane protein YozV